MYIYIYDFFGFFGFNAVIRFGGEDPRYIILKAIQ
jgi:hypothetical protein